jgi:diguanylate cyclase (GGDEF)-like protein/PAS domain S-box-containing protein
VTEQGATPASAAEDTLKGEVARLNKIIRALMDRAEHSTSAQGSDFSLFQTTVMLEERVQRRTIELESALRENEKITRALRESEAKFRGLVSMSLVGIVIIENGIISYANAKFAGMFGYAGEEIRGFDPLEFVIEQDHPMVAEQIRKRRSGEIDHLVYTFRGRCKDGREIDVECHGGAMDVDGRWMLISLLMDITERTRAAHRLQTLQEELRELSTHDPLTGLYNRRYLQTALARELIAARRHAHPVSLVLGDLDHFKQINDRYGHLGGDAVLRVFGNLMKQHARGSDIFCRYGGEEFLLVMLNATLAIAVDRAEQLRRAIAAAAVPFGKSLIDVTASFGVATFPGDGTSDDELVGAADRALYAAKAAGRNCVIAASPLP